MAMQGNGGGDQLLLRRIEWYRLHELAAEALVMPTEMLLNEARNEIVAMIVARAQA
jgi:hypothetical protein